MLILALVLLLSLGLFFLYRLLHVLTVGHPDGPQTLLVVQGVLLLAFGGFAAFLSRSPNLLVLTGFGLLCLMMATALWLLALPYLGRGRREGRRVPGRMALLLLPAALFVGLGAFSTASGLFYALAFRQIPAWKIERLGSLGAGRVLVDTGELQPLVLIHGYPRSYERLAQIPTDQPRLTYMPEYVPYEALNPNLIDAVLTREDRDFFQQSYLRTTLLSVPRMVVKRRGASGIIHQSFQAMCVTQEWDCVTADTGAGGRVQRVSQKITEENALLLNLRSLFPGVPTARLKERFLEYYLNSSYMSGVYGAGSYARAFFGKNQQDLNLVEAIIVANTLNNNFKRSMYLSEGDKERARTPQEDRLVPMIETTAALVLDHRRDLPGFAEWRARAYSPYFDESGHLKVGLFINGRSYGTAGRCQGGVISDYTCAAGQKRGSYAAYVQGKLQPRYEHENDVAMLVGSELSHLNLDLSAGDLSVKTTLRPDLQARLRPALSLAPLLRRPGEAGQLVVSSVVLSEGKIRAFDFFRPSGEPLQAKISKWVEPPASSIKPFVYGWAVSHGFVPLRAEGALDSLYHDDPSWIRGQNKVGNTLSCEGPRYSDYTPWSRILNESHNVPFYVLGQDIKDQHKEGDFFAFVRKAQALDNRLGIVADDQKWQAFEGTYAKYEPREQLGQLSFYIGGPELYFSPFGLAALYDSLQHQGQAAAPTIIESITRTGRGGKTETLPLPRASQTIFSPAVNADVLRRLQDNVSRQCLINFGGWEAGRGLFGKTGTNSSGDTVKDYWTVVGGQNYTVSVNVTSEEGAPQGMNNLAQLTRYEMTRNDKGVWVPNSPAAALAKQVLRAALQP